MKKTLFAAAVVAAFTFSACSENTTENTEATAEHHDDMDHGHAEAGQADGTVVVETPDYGNVAEPFKTQVSQLVDQYMKLTDALVASDPATAKAAANEVLTVAKAMPIATLTTDEKAYAEEHTAVVVDRATKIAGSDDLAAQRENLEPLSESVFSMAKAFDAADGTLYYQHCPMAFNNKGAYWVSSKEEIRNPYFGDAMLSCGSNKEVYKK
ncbi:Cu(I)/Ag(I) efflux system membrane fusion protein [Pontibacter aydingkolensis]|uniref:DUF3347 domain-containing protein n=1 Tax=Pontibacter aydingkolensis TaxID=1911536 RepID=A0ABS7CS42_9BACT|nr:DUF3347 domain-containing protein [Pontibacter aydingkolensis]MBW7466676.1 DUF3347 domain-containing protein [Pontibacter aydingkolensis]